MSCFRYTMHAPSFVMRSTERHALESRLDNVADTARWPSTKNGSFGPHVTNALRGVKCAQQSYSPARLQLLANNQYVIWGISKIVVALTHTIPFQRRLQENTIFRITSRSSPSLHLSIYHSTLVRLVDLHQDQHPRFQIRPRTFSPHSA